MSWPATAATPRRGWSGWWARWPRAAYRCVVAAFAWKGRGAPSRQGPWTAPDLRAAAYALLTFELLVAFLGGSYWLHYLMGLVPGVVLFAAAFAQRPAPVTRSIGGSLALAGISTVAALGWVGRTRSTGPRRRRSPTSTTTRSRATAPWWCSAPPTWSTTPTWRRRTPTSGACPRGSATPTWPPWTGCSRATERPTWVIVAHRSVDVWELDFTERAGGARRRLRRGGHGRQVHHLPPHRRMTRSIDRARPRDRGVRRRTARSGRWLVGIPNDPIGVALWLWLLAICWRLDWSLAVPEGLVAVAAGPRGLRPGARRHRRPRLHALRGVADPRRRVAGPASGAATSCRRCPCSTGSAATRATGAARSGGTTSRRARPTPRTS